MALSTTASTTGWLDATHGLPGDGVVKAAGVSAQGFATS